MVEPRHITRIESTEILFRANGDHGQSVICTDASAETVLTLADTWQYYNDDASLLYAVPAMYTWNSAASFTYVDTIHKDIYATGNMYVAQYLYHYGDTDTRINFTADQIDVEAGGVTFLRMTETAQDILTVNPGSVDLDFGVKTASGNTWDFFVQGSSGWVGIGSSAGTPYGMLDVRDTTLTSTAGMNIIGATITKTAGASDASDDYQSVRGAFTLNQSSGVIGDIRSGYFTATVSDGEATDVVGVEGWGSVSGATSVAASVYAGRFYASAGSGTVSGDIAAIWGTTNNTTGVGGSAYQLKLEETAGTADFGIHQTMTGAGPNLVLAYDATDHADFYTDSSGNLKIDMVGTGNDTSVEFLTQTDATDTIQDTMILTHLSTGNTASGFGQALVFSSRGDTPHSIVDAARIESVFASIQDDNSELRFSIRDSNTTTEILRLARGIITMYDTLAIGANLIGFDGTAGEGISVDTSGHVGVGLGANTISGTFETTKSGAGNSNCFSCYSATPTQQAALVFKKSASDTIGTPAATGDGEALGYLRWQGVDSGSGFDTVARITVTQEGATDANLGGRMGFWTQPKGGALTENLGVESDGGITAPNMASGADEGASGAAVGEMWIDTSAANVVKYRVS